MPINSPDPMKQATNEAIDNPQVGDRFSAMNTFWVFWVLVVHRAGEKVVTIEGSPPLRFPDEGTLRAYSSLEKFKKWFSDDTVSAKGYWVRLVDRGHNVQGWYSPGDEMRTEGVVSMPSNMPPLLPKCFYCHKGITGEPYVIKQFPSTNKYHPYHMNCFLNTHKLATWPMKR